MLFSSPVFFLFFACYFVLHQFVPARTRNILIVAGGTIFYAWWRVAYAWLPFFLAGTAYAGALWMARAATDGARRRRAACAIFVLFLPLLIYKYGNFLASDVVGPLVGWSGRLFDVSLPLGVSFMTFTLCAYIVDIARRSFLVRHSGMTVLAYVVFFPHLIAGPILRPGELIPQLERPRPARVSRMGLALALFTLGLVKKLVVADPIALTVDAAYRHAADLTAPQALLAVYGFAVQIYCDFSGYTDMALGLALMLGVRLPINFRRPYGATSLVEFWRRWHMTLSLWLRDYLYIPLGGSRLGRVREAVNIIVTMALGGLWHGANWTFLLWGVLHGVGVTIAHAFRRIAGPGRRLLPDWLAVLITFHVVTLAWVFFRAPSIGSAAAMLHAVFAGGGWDHASRDLGENLFVAGLIGATLALHRFDDHRRVRHAVRRLRPEIFWPVLIALWVLAITISQGNSAKFIYFDF